MNEYYIAKFEGFKCVVKFNKLISYVPGDSRDIYRYITDFYIIYADGIDVSRKRNYWRPKDGTEKFSDIMLIKKENLYEFETDEEALLFYEVM